MVEIDEQVDDVDDLDTEELKLQNEVEHKDEVSSSDDDLQELMVLEVEVDGIEDEVILEMVQFGTTNQLEVEVDMLLLLRLIGF